MTDQVIEIAPFHLSPDRSESELLEASERFQKEFLEEFDGFVRRSLVKHEDGAYADIVTWATGAASKAAVAAAGKHAAGQAYFSLLDVSKEHAPRKAGAMEFFSVVGTYG
ncbi:hypothetical protein PsAD2_04490 [Pseudovibrio axinellae]|uniref:ABM domain-containing protein n=1 Tax=Pseudovibrio axinellae TaxID=989403 RepID=A0A165T0S0_9HYPH|nr:hypothetical protein [Pseudovibrio axinellae]KZL05135.1 hypothetical protein PsAD2_04490 [Pseudovibrio axinellae]SER49548.1 hypothetical protein SAMN05421798_11152 [Pseudovibrio axinellae]